MAILDTNAGGHTMRREWRELGRLALESLATGALVSLALALAVLVISFDAHAGGGDGTGRGTLLLRGAGGGQTAAPTLLTDVHIAVTGLSARVQVRQRFVNPSADWCEGVYVFPLPEKAAVDHLTMHIGERLIEGQIRERAEARQTYDNAKSEGRRATLVEQERPNLFTTSVANIGPHEEIVVALEYQEVIRYDDGAFRLRFPLAITPRYIPGAAAADIGPAGAAAPAPVPDADRVTPPFADPRGGFVNPVALVVDLNAGFPLMNVESRYHAINVEEQPGKRYRLTLADGPVPAARDFELVWTPEVGSAPGAALFTETKGDRTYALLMALPPSTAHATAPRIAREVTYIVDTSGSMEGVSIAQAREALLLALPRLQPGDRFNVIEFNSSTTPLFSAPMPVDKATLARASAFVGALRARGGTEMLPALAAALAGERESSRVRQIVFLTDGAVGNEDAILRLLHERLGDRRLFTVGIGPAPNTFFLTKAAQLGRGSFTFIGDVREVGEKMNALLRKLERPAMTDIAIDWPGAADAWPRVVPDLYEGEPVVVSAQFPAGMLPGAIAIRGRRGEAAWGTLLPFGGGADLPGVAVLWARARIDALMDAGRRGLPETDVRDAVLDLALTHHLVSKYTSLVAEDVTPARPAGVDALSTALPGNIPEGLARFEVLPRTATPASLSMVIGLLLLLAAAALVLSTRLARRRWS